MNGWEVMEADIRWKHVVNRGERKNEWMMRRIQLREAKRTILFIHTGFSRP
jgi:hypothetical protein